MVDRKIVKQLQTELRNTDKADYRGYTIVKQPTIRYWIASKIDNDVVFHASVLTVAEAVKWIDSEWHFVAEAVKWIDNEIDS